MNMGSCVNNRQRFGFGVIFLASVVGFLMIGPLTNKVRAQDEPTPTVNATPPAFFITVSFNEQINVHTGPSSVYYPTIGSLSPMTTAPAVGRSQGKEWIEIIFDEGPGGFGWVYAPLVQLTPSNIDLLPVVDPPPTPTPVVVITIDPTIVAALQLIPTNTRPPTFTAPPPIQIHAYQSPSGNTPAWLNVGWIVLAFALLGIVGIFFSYFKR